MEGEAFEVMGGVCHVRGGPDETRCLYNVYCDVTIKHFFRWDSERGNEHKQNNRDPKIKMAIQKNETRKSFII